jgi:signal transduction histidine kinase/CheY-like chemotaxis protein
MNIEAIGEFVSMITEQFEIPGMKTKSDEKEEEYLSDIEPHLLPKTYFNPDIFVQACLWAYYSLTFTGLAKVYFEDGYDALFTYTIAVRVLSGYLLTFNMDRLARGRTSYVAFVKLLWILFGLRVLVMLYEEQEKGILYAPLFGYNLAFPVMMTNFGRGLSIYHKVAYCAGYGLMMVQSLVQNWGKTLQIEVSWNLVYMLLVQAIIVMSCSYYIYSAETTKSSLIRELKNLVSIARSSSDAKTMFISNISHDLRTPIHAILGLITLIEESVLDSVQHSYVTSMKSSCYNLTSVINNVLDFAKIENNKMDFQQRDVDLFMVVQNVTDSMTSLIEEKDLHMLIDLSVPSDYRYVKSDDNALSRILTNLIGNAIKFTEKGHVKLTIKCIPRKPSHAIKASVLGCSEFDSEVTADYLFYVEDSGRGMTPHFIQTKLFNPFSQENTSLNAAGREGTGLGLSLSQRIVQKLGGKIQVDSVCNKGTTFYFSLVLGVVKNPGSNTNLTVLKELIPFQVATSVCEMGGVLDPLMHKMMRDEIDDWDGVLGPLSPISPQDTLDLSEQARIVFLIDRMSDRAAQCKEIPACLTNIDNLGKQSVLCFLLISRARRDSVASNNLTFQTLERKERIKVATILLPLTPLKLHKALSTCVTFIKTTAHNGFPSSRPSFSVSQQNKPGPLQHVHILVVEDNPMIATVLSKLLQKNQIPHTLANNGKKGVEAWEASPDKYQVILMDIQMPIMDGFTAVSHIRRMEEEKNVKRAKIIFTSANASVEEIAHAKEIGGDEYLTKPVEFNILVNTLKKLLS